MVSVKQFRSRSGPTKKSGLILAQTVLKHYQQTTVTGKELNSYCNALYLYSGVILRVLSLC